ncbi:MAG: hypothetical protein Q8P40_07260 [Nitrospirota bacterium]|nr:hypothetical protein [Nitrospirota bacterium]
MMFFALPKNSSTPGNATEVITCKACHPKHDDELKRAYIHASMQCADCHSPGSFGHDDPYSHNATTLACAESIRDNRKF